MRLAKGGSRIDRSRAVRFRFDDVEYEGFAGDTIASALLASNPSAAEQAAQSMRSLAIPESKLRTAVDNYAEAILALSVRERQIADIDREVLGSDGRLIGRVTELLREVSASRSHVLSRDIAKTLGRD